MSCHPFDESIVRRISAEKDIPIVDLMLKAIDELSPGLERRATLLGICPISRSTIRASIECAKFLNFPLIFVATLNQVDIDGGYTGLTPKDFVNLVGEECKRLMFSGPTIIALDHGGPWQKDKHVIEKLGFDETFEWMKKSIEACIKAGYDLLHIDTTLDIWLKEKGGINVDTIIKRTADLMEHAEEIRRQNDLPKLSYEVGTEEIHGGMTSPQSFKEFILKLKEELRRRGLEEVWPCFIVGNVGTYLAPVNHFDSEKARALVEIARSHNLYVKGHYTDYVSNPEDYPRAGMGGANIGPELAHAEYSALEELSEIEKMLHDSKYILDPSKVIEKLNESIIKSGRWRKWLIGTELSLDFNELPAERRKWLLGTGARYVLSSPEITEARAKLEKNLMRCGLNSEIIVLMKIRDVIWKYAHAFNLIDLTRELTMRLLKCLAQSSHKTLQQDG
ncbi:MAG: class II D-tagatose-bisphosphate aldolase, non-catalytic subunit [Nitrososphaerota archaeon]